MVKNISLIDFQDLDPDFGFSTTLLDLLSIYCTLQEYPTFPAWDS